MYDLNYDEMTKEELIQYIKECKEKRAFTYEDQMKLAFLDSSPFTLWASDRNCRIKLWMGQCEALYGYKSEDVLGKDFVDLFVADDEQKAAREDQISIIDDGAVFHNIANDVGKNGNTLRLLTNCWRLKDPISGEYWNAEMGLIIDFFNQEVVRLEQIITESRMLKTRVTQFIDCTKQYKGQFLERKKLVNEAIRECDRKAVAQKKRKEFKAKTKEVKSGLAEIEEKINTIIEDYLNKVKACGSSSECENLIQKFKSDCDGVLFQFEDLITDFQEISLEYDEKGGTIFGKDSLLKDVAVVYGAYYSKAFNLKIRIEKEIDDYKSLGNISEESLVLSSLLELREAIESILKRISKIELEVYEKVTQLKSEEEISIIRESVNKEYENIDKCIKEIEDRLGR